MLKRLLVLSLALMLLTVGRSSAAPTEMDWISHLPGVTLGSHNVTDSSMQNTYTLTGNATATFRTIIKQLQDRGWEVGNGSRVAAGPTQILSLVARRGSITMNLSLNGTANLSTLMLTAQAPPGTFPVTHVTPPAGTSLSGPQITLNNNHQKATLNGSSSTAVINGNENSLTFSGSWKTVTITGNDNVLSFDSSVDEIVLNGSSNQVSWSGSKNAHEPKIVDHGDINAINKTP